MMRTEPSLDEISAAEARLLSTFEQAAVGIAHVAETGRLVRVNQKFCSFLGYSSSELLDKGFPELTHPDDLHEDLRNAALLLAGKIETYTIEKRYFRKDKSIVW